MKLILKLAGVFTNIRSLLSLVRGFSRTLVRCKMNCTVLGVHEP